MAISAELLTALATPFPGDAIHWRVGSTTKDNKRGMALAYIDARDVMNRLDEVCCGEWGDSYTEVCGRIVCSITIYGQTRADGAGDTAVEAEKGGLSDAFKRSAVKWGVGRYLYRLPSEWVALDAKKRIQTPPSLPHWALPKGEISDQDIDFERIENEDKTIAQQDENRAAQELIRAILDLEATLLNADQMSAEQREKVRKKYAQVIKLEAGTVENLSNYYDQLVNYKRAG